MINEQRIIARRKAAKLSVKPMPPAPDSFPCKDPYKSWGKEGHRRVNTRERRWTESTTRFMQSSYDIGYQAAASREIEENRKKKAQYTKP